MCRLLAVHDRSTFEIDCHLKSLARIARNSSEYQGDGWGCAWREQRRWHLYRNIRPIWEDDLGRFGRADLLLAHARSAFRNEGLEVENNMPFAAGPDVFVFNGELRGVRIRESGRIGAEKLFRFLLRFTGGCRSGRLQQALDIVKKRTRYVRAMNLVLAGRDALCVHAYFNEAPSYFTLYRKIAGASYMVCSEPYPGDSGWSPLPNDYLEVRPF